MAHVGKRAGWGALAAAMVAAAGATFPLVSASGVKGQGQAQPHPARSKRATAAAAPAVPNALKRWAATNGGGPTAQTPTLAQAQAAAANYDLILATKKSYPPYVSAMRQTNPALRIVAYLNGVYAQSDEGTAYPEAWYARDATGAKVRSKKFGNYLMNPTHPGWIQSRADLCTDYATSAGYDGCYLDMLGNATVGQDYVTAAPINPATGREWTRPSWIADTSKLAATVQTADAPLLIVGNGLANGNQYFDPASGPTSTLLNGLAGGNAQGWVRSEADAITQFRAVKQWKRDVDMLGDAGSKGRFVMAMTKVGRAATPAQMQQVHRYALASFLLGTDGTQYFYFSPNGNDDGVDAPDTPDDHVNPGMPSARYATQASGAYVRPFTNGYVAVNPTAAAVNVNLGGPYTDLDGHTVTQAALPPHTGMVFTKQGTTSTTAAAPTTTTVPTTTTTACVRRPRTTTTKPAAQTDPHGANGAPGPRTPRSKNALTAAGAAPAASTTPTTARAAVVSATTTTAVTKKATAATPTTAPTAESAELRPAGRRCRPRRAP